jgi:UDP-N-acetylglucosamine--N-acetylmuramyl-(pentapeptide) pyrophosphoryl-undecaprenol N-acetylglucosamine transferase
VIHEQTTTGGLANRFIGSFADKIALTFEGSAPFFPEEKIVITGNPLRNMLENKSKKDKHFHFIEKLPTVYITGGSQGAHSINRLVGKTLPELLEFCNVIHQCGGSNKTKDYDWLLEQKDALPVSLRKRYYCLPYLDDARQQEAYTKADLAVSRAGAGTLNELAQLKIPSVLIPLPPHVNDEQTKNAEYFTKNKAAVMYEQKELEETPEKLPAILKHLLLKNRSLLDVMKKNLDGFVPRDATEAIAKLLLDYCNR